MLTNLPAIILLASFLCCYYQRCVPAVPSSRVIQPIRYMLITCVFWRQRLPDFLFCGVSCRGCFRWWLRGGRWSLYWSCRFWCLKCFFRVGAPKTENKSLINSLGLWHRASVQIWKGQVRLLNARLSESREAKLSRQSASAFPKGRLHPGDCSMMSRAEHHDCRFSLKKSFAPLKISACHKSEHALKK